MKLRYGIGAVMFAAVRMIGRFALPSVTGDHSGNTQQQFLRVGRSEKHGKPPWPTVTGIPGIASATLLL